MRDKFLQAALAAGIAFGIAVPALAADPVVLRMTTMSPGGSRNFSVWFQPWAQKINAAANGAIQIEVRFGYWLALAALALGTGAAFMAMSGRPMPQMTVGPRDG